MINFIINFYNNKKIIYENNKEHILSNKKNYYQSNIDLIKEKKKFIIKMLLNLKINSKNYPNNLLIMIYSMTLFRIIFLIYRLDFSFFNFKF